jgi:hypothetical protein
MTAEDWIDAGDSVIVAIHYRGRGRVSGIAVDDLWWEVHTFRGDRCVSKAEYRNREDALAAAQSDG